ncbi:MAG: hypothetical protein HDR03_11185 [Lachnospiraceae bacterium]|nr:hypothetical protein [Lachnospiraceae bacterium]
MDKNETEKKKLKEWGLSNCQQYQFQKSDKEKESYFIEMDPKPYIREYGFETLPQLMEELNQLWKDHEEMEQVKKIVGVAAMKNRISYDSFKEYNESTAANAGEKLNEQDKLPKYIYNF